MTVAVGERKHVDEKLFIGVLRRLSRARKRFFRERAAYLLRHGLPRWAFAESREKVEGVVHHAVSERPELGPITGVE